MPPHPRPVRRRAFTALAATALAVTAAGVAAPTVAGADPEDPPATPWVVSMGDSYISGEGGRWAGNETGVDLGIDTGSDAYFDNADGTAEVIPFCHRSKAAMIHLGLEVNSKNLACSGATTASAFDTKNDNHWKPGIDNYDDGKGHIGQAKLLQQFATTNPVKMVVLSIGGNDFNFGDIVEACVKDYLKPNFVFWSGLCSDDDDVTGYVSAARQKAVRADIATSIANIRDAMRKAGRADGDWTLVVNTYPQVLPYPNAMRYADGGWDRQTVGGCGFRNGDLTWALNSALGRINDTVRGAVKDATAASPANRYVVMENGHAFDQRALCDRHVSRVADPSFSAPWVWSWTSAGAADASEWVTEINIVNPFAHYKQESLHPNHWGQMALRNCLRQVWNGGAVRGGTCVRADGGGVNDRGEPNMVLGGALSSPAPVAVNDHYVVSGGGTFATTASVLTGDIDPPAYVAPVTDVTPSASDKARNGFHIHGAAGLLNVFLDRTTANGTLDLVADGTFAYTPAPGFTGTDSFTYVAQDFFGASEPATVTLEVSAASTPAPTPAQPVQASPSFTG